jgi:hypothetical protein
MRIGYSVEGSTDRALLEGLRRRWCPKADLVQGRFRGTSRQSQRREIPNTCVEMASKQADLVLFLRDANKEEWRDVLRKDEERCRSEHRHIAVFGVCDRNVECWLCADADWLAKQIGRPARDFRVEDPKAAFESALGVCRSDRKEEEIAGLVKDAPLQHWLANPSFEDFYGKLRDAAKRFPCEFENLRERSA